MRALPSLESPRRALRLRGASAAVACLAALLAGPPPAAAGVTGQVAISFDATSTLHGFEGQAAPVSVVLEPSAGGGWSADLSVPISAIDTGIERRNARMRAMFDADHYPVIRGRVRGVEPEQVQHSGLLPFALVIRDEEHPVQARVSHWQQDADGTRFDADFDVSLAEFGLEAPRVLFVRVGDVVHVRVHVTLEPA